jgi:hypothetical protein
MTTESDKNSDCWGRRAAWLFGIGIGLVWLTAAMMPLYPDEIAYRIINSRLFFEHGFLNNVYVTCSASFAHRAPWLWYPAELLDYALFGWYDNPAYYRVASLVVMGSVFAGAIVVLRGQGYSRLGCRFFILLLSLGIIPFSLIMVRPESMLWASLFWLIAFSLDRSKALYQGWLSALAFFFLSSLLLSAHPESFIFLPALLALFIFWARRDGVTWPVRGALAMVTGALVVISARFWSIYSTCPENPQIQKNFDGIVLSPFLLVKDPAAFLHAFVASLADSGAYFKYAMLHGRYNSDWLPRRPYGWMQGLDIVETAMLSIVVLSCIAAIVYGIVIFVRKAIQAKSLREMRPAPAAFVGCLLLLTLFGFIGINRGKQFYEVAFVFPLLFMGLFLWRPTFPWLTRLAENCKAPAALAGVAILVGMVAALSFLPSFMKGFEGLGVSVVTTRTDKVEQQIATLSAACGLPSRPEDAVHPIVDDLTYQFFRQSHDPVLVTWLYVATEGMDRRAFMAHFKTSGLLARCRYIPDELKATPYFYGPDGVGNADDDLCCVAPGYYDVP